MQCFYCQRDHTLVKIGTYSRKSDQKKFQRLSCKVCCKSFSTQIFSPHYRYRKRNINQVTFRLLCSSVSQRRSALIIGINRKGIASRVRRFGRLCQMNLALYRQSRELCEEVIFDEMESFEHSKCKPLTIPIAVEGKTRKILSLDVGKIAAKGHLSAIAKKKYGKRTCERKKSLHKVLGDIKTCCTNRVLIKSDESGHYPNLIKHYFPLATHKTFKGRRGCVVGQGELKEGGFDPLFSLNHTFAMIRDNLKTLTRRTWCTTKKPERLLDLLNIHAWYHNLQLDNPTKIILRAINT